MLLKSSALSALGLGLIFIVAPVCLAQNPGEFKEGFDGPFHENDGFRVNLNTRSYKFYTAATFWLDAKRTCERDGATLAVINSAAEENFLGNLFFRFWRNIAYTNNESMAWIGISRSTSGAPWTTVFGEQPRSLNWATLISSTGAYLPQPDNKYGQENCAALAFKKTLRYGLSDVQCDRKLAFVCEKVYNIYG